MTHETMIILLAVYATGIPFLFGLNELSIKYKKVDHLPRVEDANCLIFWPLLAAGAILFFSLSVPFLIISRGVQYIGDGIYSLIRKDK